MSALDKYRVKNQRIIAADGGGGAAIPQEDRRTGMYRDRETNADEVRIDYTNYRGERRWRRIRPLRVEFKANSWHPVEQWQLIAYDFEKEQFRDFAMKEIHAWEPVTLAPVVER